MKKLMLSLVLCLALCTAAVFAEELKVEYFEMTYEHLESMSADCNSATLFGDDGEGVYEELEKRILDSLKNGGKMIPVDDLEIQYSQIDNIVGLFSKIITDNPYYSFCYKYGCGYSYTNNVVVSLHPVRKDGYEEDSTVEKMQSAIDKATAEILDLIDEDMTDFQKVMTVHDYMVLNYEYDSIVNENPEADVVRDVTMMVTKKGVCMGYAYAFKHVMNKLGIECGYVVSDAMNHEWNVVKIDGEWYHIDVTHDDPLFGGKYDAFATVYHTKALLSSAAILNEGSYDFVLPEGVEANSKKYDDAPWRINKGAVVTLKGVTYYVDGNNLVDETGKVIHENLAKRYGTWNGFGNGNNILLLCGLAPYYGKLYFNTENAIYSYDPDSGKTEKFLDANGISGLYIKGDVLYYGKYETDGNMLVKICKYGEEDISYMRVDETLVHDISAIVVMGKIDEMTEKQKYAANLYVGDEEDGVVKINIKDIIKMAQLIASKKK